MRFLRLGILGLLSWRPLPATLIPGPNLAKRIETAGAIVSGKLVRGTTLASGSQVSSDLVLHVDRVLKGDLIPGTDIAAHLEGRGMFVAPKPTQSAIPQQIFGIWFLSAGSSPYAVISRDGTLGEIYFAPVILPEEASAGKPGPTPAASVANEMISALHWLAAAHGAQLKPGTQSQYLTEFRGLTEAFPTIGSPLTLPAYKQLVLEESPPLRVFGIAGLIAAGDPDGVIRAAAEWSELAAAAEVPPIIISLMTYANTDPAGVQALAALALRDGAGAALRQNAVYALRAIHTKETLPALVALLDDHDDGVQSYALSGLCLFVRNAPAVTPQSVPSMSWLESRQPAPFLTETQPYCSLGGKIDPAKLDAYVSFWKSWWSEHRANIEDR